MERLKIHFCLYSKENLITKSINTHSIPLQNPSASCSETEKRLNESIKYETIYWVANYPGLDTESCIILFFPWNLIFALGFIYAKWYSLNPRKISDKRN